MAQTTTLPELIKGKDIVGLKVITLQKGQNIEDIDELIYDPKAGQIVALVVDTGGWFSDAKVILFEDIKTIGKDAIIVESDQVLKKASDVKQEITRIVKEENYLTENTIITEDGTELGKVSDVYFIPATGKVMELEVSQGIKNIQSGKKRIKVEDIIRIGEDATIVKGYVEEKVEEQAKQQGLQGALNKTKETTQEKAPSFIEQTKQKAQEISMKVQESVKDAKDNPENKQKFEDFKTKTVEVKDAAVQKINEGKETAGQKMDEGKTKIDEKKRNDALGKYVTINVLSKTDAILAHRGDMITNQLLLQAEQNGMLEQVLGNMSNEPVLASEAQPVQTPPEKVIVDMNVQESEAKAEVFPPKSIPTQND